MKKLHSFFGLSLIILGLLIIPKITMADNYITSISPTKGAIGDEITIMIPFSKTLFPECWIPGETSYGSTSGCKFSAKAYFNNIEVVPAPNYYDFSGRVLALVPAGATNGKIKIEITALYAYHNKNYNTTLISSSDFTVITSSAQDDLSVRQQYLQQTKVDQAWSYTHGSSNVVVAVIDDGVYTGHPDLDGNMWVNSGEIEGNGKDDDGNGFVDDKWGWDFISNSKDMTTLGTHGTMVAGIIGAESNNATGITGINWNIKLMPVIVCNDKGCNDEAIKKGIKYAVDNGADIINLSLGGDIFDYSDDFNDIIKYAFDKNVLVVIAAGNGDLEGGIGRNLNITKVSPVCNDGSQNMVLGVGAVDANNQLTSWSNYGGCADIYAPGEDIVSTAVPVYSTLSGFYDSADGTSFSAPIISGIAALIKAKYPTIKNTAIRDRIINNSDYQNGLKIVNAYKAVSQSFNDTEKYTDNTPVSTPTFQNTTDDITNTDNNYVKQDKDSITPEDSELSNRLKGKILLQVENHGEAYYVNPKDSQMYYMADGNEAYRIMHYLGVGITNSDLDKIKNDKNFAKKHSGKIFLQVEAHGEAYYIDFDGNAHYLKDGSAAYNIMRDLGLGITNNDLDKIPVGNL